MQWKKYKGISKQKNSPSLSISILNFTSLVTDCSVLTIGVGDLAMSNIYVY